MIKAPAFSASEAALKLPDVDRVRASLVSGEVKVNRRKGAVPS